MPTPKTKLPEIRSIRIHNMTTFPKDLKQAFSKGITCVFGGNFSGKTTFVNAIKFSLLGLTLTRDTEELSAAAFSSRIKKTESRSLTIDFNFEVQNNVFMVNRKIYASGNPELNFSVSEKGTGKISSGNATKEYMERLLDKTGLNDSNDLKFLSKVIFSDENHSTVLWSKKLNEFVLKLCIPEEQFEQIEMIDFEINKFRKEKEKIIEVIKRFQKNIKNLEISRRILDNRLTEIRYPDIDRLMDKYNIQFSDLQKIIELKNSLEMQKEVMLSRREKLLSKEDRIRTEKITTEEKRNKREAELYHSYIYSDDPQGLNLIKHLRYGKRCPVCDNDISRQIENRISSKQCLICGEQISKIEFRDTEDLRQEIDKLLFQEKDLKETLEEVENERKKFENKYKTLSEDLHNTNQQKETLEEELEKFDGILKNNDMILLISDQIDDLRIQRETLAKKIEKQRPKIQNIDDDLKKLQELREKNIKKIRDAAKDFILSIRSSFSKFIEIATNNEINCTLNEELIPSLKGRKIFVQDDASQYEHILIDYAFRFSLLDVYSSSYNRNPFLVVEMPDQIVDEALLPFLAKAMAKMAKNFSLILTTANSKFLENLKTNFVKCDIINLVELGTTTQKKYYQMALDEFIGVKADAS